MKKLDENKLETPKDLPIGTILTNHYANMIAFYRVEATTNKSVVLQELEFETGPDSAGYPYVSIWPLNNAKAYSEPKRKIVKFLKTGGFYIPAVIGHGSLGLYDEDHKYSVYWD